MTPDGVAPPVSFARAFDDVFLIDLNAQPGPRRDVDHAVFIVEDRGVGDVVEQVVARVVVDAQALFLDERVVAAGIDLQAGGERDRAQRAVQRERDIVGFGHHRDLPRLGDAACMGDVGLDDVDGTGGDHLAEVPAGEQSLPSAIGVGVFGEHRFFDEEESVGFKFLDEDLGHRLVHATMEVDAEAEIFTGGLTYRLHVLAYVEPPCAGIIRG